MSTRRSMTHVAAVVLCLCGVTFGCAQGDREVAQSAANDALIAAQVHAKAAAVDAATVTLVHAKCERGAVTLTGKVASASERTAVEKAARSVNGVRSVDDRIVVDPSAPTGKEIEADLTLAAKIKAALVAQTGANATRIHVDVHKGIVTLTGTLPSAAHREVADQTVRGVTGVVKLNDKITIAKT